MRLVLAILLALLLPASARADITIRNFNGGGTGFVFAVMQRDENNNAVDAHDGMILQNGGNFYLYGTSYGCGFQWNDATTPFCGFNVYTSTDLGYNKKWQLVGKIFDATTTAWQNSCKGTGCFELRVIFNPTTSKYVFWFNQPGGTPSVADNEQVFTCSSPTCGATLNSPGTPTFQTPPSALAHGPVSSSQALFVDTDNSCYVLYNNPTGSRENYIDKLNSACTESTGTSVDTNLTAEGDALFMKGGVYYAMTGSTCPYCTGSATFYSSASSIMGTYSSSTQISATSCGGQIQSVNVIVAGGITTYLYAADLWTGATNESTASFYYEPLTFTAGAINSLPCSVTATVSGVTPDPNPTVQPFPYPNQDQSSGNFGFNDFCDIGNGAGGHYRMQTFVPTKSPVAAIYMPLGQDLAAANLTVSLVTVDGSNNPVSTLASYSFTPSSLAAAADWTLIPLHSAVTPSTTYGIVLESAGSGCYIVPIFYGTFPNPYSAGVERISSDGGSTWTTETSRALMFSTQPPIAGVGRFFGRP